MNCLAAADVKAIFHTHTYTQTDTCDVRGDWHACALNDNTRSNLLLCCAPLLFLEFQLNLTQFIAMYLRLPPSQSAPRLMAANQRAVVSFVL